MNNKHIIFSVVIFAICCAFYVSAWNEPTNTPPSDNASAPINVSDSDQIKDGGFSLKKFLRLIPGSAPATPENGMAYYDNTANAFKCREGDTWLNCVGGFFQKMSNNLISLLDFGSGRVRITNVATPAGDEDSDVATVGYVKAQMTGGSSSGGLAMWYIKTTPNSHDGNFGGWPGIDQYCKAELSDPTCVVFSSDIFHSVYAADEALDFSTWGDIALRPRGWWGSRFETGLTGFNPGMAPVPMNWNSNSTNCLGWTSAAIAPVTGYTFNYNGALVNNPCNVALPVVCACLNP